jgi:tetratricopeptide (TPR) repeat protein
MTKEWTAYGWLAQLRIVEGRYADAEVVCTRAIERGHAAPEVYQIRAWANMRQGRLQEARRDCEHLAQVDSDSCDTHATWGEFHLHSWEIDAALNRYQRALAEGATGSVHFQAATAFVFGMRFDDARRAFETGLTMAEPFELRAAIADSSFWSTAHPGPVMSTEAQSLLREFHEKLVAAGRGLQSGTDTVVGT